MTKEDQEGQRERIRTIAENLNRAWMASDWDQLKEFFREKMVMVAPGLRQRLEGRAACVRSFQEFQEQAEVQSFQEADWQIDILGETAVAIYNFEIAYKLDGELYNETGHETLLFQREGDRWLVVWRTLHYQPKP